MVGFGEDNPQKINQITFLWSVPKLLVYTVVIYSTQLGMGSIFNTDNLIISILNINYIYIFNGPKYAENHHVTYAAGNFW